MFSSIKSFARDVFKNSNSVRESKLVSVLREVMVASRNGLNSIFIENKDVSICEQCLRDLGYDVREVDNGFHSGYVVSWNK